MSFQNQIGIFHYIRHGLTVANIGRRRSQTGSSNTSAISADKHVDTKPSQDFPLHPTQLFHCRPQSMSSCVKNPIWNHKPKVVRAQPFLQINTPFKLKWEFSITSDTVKPLPLWPMPFWAKHSMWRSLNKIFKNL
jgi:hypothetical protein